MGYLPLSHVSGSSHGLTLQPQPPFIPPLTLEDERGEQRERQRSRKSPESSSDDHSDDDFYDAATSDMEVDSWSDMDSTPAMVGKGKGVEVASAPRPTNTQLYSEMAAYLSNSAQSSASTAAYRQGPSYDTHRTQENPWSTSSHGKQNYPSLPSQKPSLCVVGLRLYISYELIWLTYLPRFVKSSHLTTGTENPILHAASPALPNWKSRSKEKPENQVDPRAIQGLAR
jgi:hypothetical protein